MKARYGITYSETTPESAEHGDFSDTGWEHEYRAYEPGDLKRLRFDGFRFDGGRTMQVMEWFSTQWECTDYRTGTERELNLHFECVTEATLNRMARYLASKPVLGGPKQ